MPYSSGPPKRFSMDFLAMYVTYSCLVFERFLGSKHRENSGPAPLRHCMLLACLFTHTGYRMTKPRGRPKRGSP
jgi:hypothetical protein